MAGCKNEKTLDLNKEEQELSESEDEDLEVLPTKDQYGPNGKELTFNHTDRAGLSRDLKVLAGQVRVYYMEVSNFTRNKPDITLHAGQSDGLVLAASHFAWSRAFKCGLGLDELSMQ